MKTKRKTKPKKMRTNIDKRIAAAKSPGVRRYLAMYGQDTPPTEMQVIIGEWQLIRNMRGNGLTVARLALAEKNGMRFFCDAMLRWDADALIELGSKMKRSVKEHGGFDIDLHRRALLGCGVSTKAVAEDLLVRGKVKEIYYPEKLENEMRALKRIKARWRKGDK